MAISAAFKLILRLHNNYAYLLFPVPLWDRTQPIQRLGTTFGRQPLGPKTKMKRQNQTNKPHHQPSADSDRRKTFVSADGQTEISVVGDEGLKRWPPHKGKVAVVRLRPEANTRIRTLSDGRTECVFRHSEILGLLYALNACECGGFVYELPKKVTHKSAEQRARWRQINEDRFRPR